jgi:hypothetical protein
MGLGISILPQNDSGSGGVSAEIIKLSDYRGNEMADSGIDLVTAVDAAIRDLQEILFHWGSEQGGNVRKNAK